MLNEDILKLSISKAATSDELLKLVGSNLDLDRLLSKHANATAEMLSQLANCDDYVVRRNVVENSSTPIEVLLRLGPKFPAQLLKNSKLDAALALDKKIPERFERATFLKLLAREHVPEAMIEWILKRGTSEQQASYLFGFNRPDSVRRKFLKSKHCEIAIALLERVDSIYIDWAKKLGWIQSPIVEQDADEMPITARMQIDDWLGEKNRQIDGLWKLLVPKEGAAATVQGEMVRSIVRIQDEFYRNGMMNWGNGFYEGMVNYISRILRSDETFGKFHKKCIEADILEIRKSGETGEDIAADRKPRSAAFGKSILFTSNVEESHDRLCALIAIWCEKHIEPIENPYYVNPRDRIVQLRSPAEYLILSTPCPKCGGLVSENDLQFCCVGQEATESGCRFAFGKAPDGRGLVLSEVEQLLIGKRIGPLDGFKDFKAYLNLKIDEDSQLYELMVEEYEEVKEVEIADFSDQEALGKCPKCGSSVFVFQADYVCENSIPNTNEAETTCDFRLCQIILRQSIFPEQLEKLLNTGSTDALDGFTSMRTKKVFKARLVWDAGEGKVNFEFANDDE